MSGGNNNRNLPPSGNQPPVTGPPNVSPAGGGGVNNRGGSNSSGRSASPANSDGSFLVVDDQQSLPDPGDYASLELLYPIIQCLGHDLASSQRLTFSSLRIVGHSTKLYKEIYDLIIKVNDSQSADWDSYEKYSTAIEPLENLLFEFAVQSDSAARKLSQKKLIEELKATKGPVYEPTDCVTVVSVWEADRTLVKKLLEDIKAEQKLKAISELSETDIKDALKHDDEAVLSALAENIAKQNLSGLRSLAKGPFASVKSKVGEIDTAFRTQSTLDDTASSKCVSSVMLVNEAIEAYKATSVATDPGNREWNVHLKKASVWEAAKTLLTTVHGHITNASNTTFTDVEKEYNKFLEALLSGSFEVPKSLLDLIKMAAKVKRPFYLQSLVLVAVCKELVNDFEAGTDRKASRFIPLDETLTAGVAALTQAAKTIDDLANLNEAGLRQKSDALFTDVNAKLVECLKVYNKQTKENDYKSQLADALGRDKVALERIQMKLKHQSPFTQGGLSGGGSSNSGQ